MSQEKRKKILRCLANILVNNSIPIIWGCIDKQKMKERYGDPFNPHVMSFVQCGEAIESYRKDKTFLWTPIIGKTDHDAAIEKMFVQCKRFGAPFGYFSKTWKGVTDFISFIDPKNSRLFQLADFVAFVISRHLQKKEDWGLYDLISKNIVRSKKFPR